MLRVLLEGVGNTSVGGTPGGTQLFELVEGLRSLKDWRKRRCSSEKGQGGKKILKETVLNNMVA